MSTAAAAVPAAGYCAVCGLAAQMVCTECRKMFYCDRKHQRQHWKMHKFVCTALASATPAAAKQDSAKHVLLVRNCGSLGDWYFERLLKHKWLWWFLSIHDDGVLLFQCALECGTACKRQFRVRRSSNPNAVICNYVLLPQLTTTKAQTACKLLIFYSKAYKTR
jgi:MYND finger